MRQLELKSIANNAYPVNTSGTAKSAATNMPLAAPIILCANIIRVFISIVPFLSVSIASTAYENGNGNEDDHDNQNQMQ